MFIGAMEQVDIKEYIEKININEDVSEEIHINDEKDDMEEFVFMGLRMVEGIDTDKFKRKFGKDVYDVYKEPIEKHIKEGLLIYDLGKLKLSPKGIEFSNYVMSDFILE